MKKKGRPSKQHAPVNATFDEVLVAIARSKYKDKKTIEKKRKERS